MKPKIKPTKIEGCLLIEPYVFKDKRGEYVETWNESAYSSLTGGVPFVQDDISVSSFGVLRGLHGDKETWKLVQCLYGGFSLVVVDFREHSKTYLTWEKFLINQGTRSQILIPPGCLNGHLCLTDRCVFSYKQTTYYNRDNQVSVRYDSFGIDWGIDHSDLILSKRDREAPYFQSKTDNPISYDMGGSI